MFNYRSSSRQITLATYSFFLVLSGVYIFSYRPVQDDLASLANQTTMGFWKTIGYAWHNFGGNVSQLMLSWTFTALRFFNSYFIGYSLEVMLTIVLVFNATLALLRFIGLNSKEYSGLIRLIACVSTLGTFASLISPGLLAAYGFVGSSLTHVWPIATLILLLEKLVSVPNKRKYHSIFFLLGGFLASNFNITEACLALSVFIIQFIQMYRLPLKNRKTRVNHFATLVGSMIGTIVIVIAPGFSNRRHLVGSSFSPHSLLYNFLKDSAQIVGDLVCHPFWIFTFLLGIIIAETMPSVSIQIIKWRVLNLVLISFMFFALTIFGDTFAYTSWYQTAGGYIILPIWTLAVGIFAGGKYQPRHVRGALLALTMVLVVLVIRDTSCLILRAHRWDLDLKSNICKLGIGKDAALAGAELRYPPFQLGVSDVNSRQWISADYSTWLKFEINHGLVACH